MKSTFNRFLNIKLGQVLNSKKLGKEFSPTTYMYILSLHVYFCDNGMPIFLPAWYEDPTLEI